MKDTPTGQVLPEGSLTRRTVAGLTWTLYGAVAEAVLSLAILTALSRLLSPGDFGLLAMGLIFVGLGDSVRNLGIGPALVQRPDLTPRHIGTAFTLLVAMGLVATVLAWGAAPAIGRALAEPMAAPVLRGLSAIFLVGALGEVSEHLLRRELRFKPLMVAKVLARSVGYGAVAIGLGLLGFGVWALVWGTVMRHAVFTLTVLAFRAPSPGWAVGRREAGDLLRLGGGFTLTSLFTVLAQRGGHFVIGSGLGAASLGYFTRALGLASLPSRLDPVASTVLFPAMAQRQRRVDRLRIVYGHGIEIVSLLALPTSVLLALSAPEIVAVVLGRQWAAAVPVLEVLAFAGAVQALKTLNPPVIRAMGAVYRESWRRALYAVLIVAGFAVASPWGLGAIAAVWVGARVVIQLLTTRLALSILGLGWRRVFRLHGPALWASLWCAPAVWWTAGAVREASLPSVGALVIECIAWGAAVVIAMILAPPFARPSFGGWAIENAALDEMGKAGAALRVVLEWLERRRLEPRWA